MKKTSNVDLVPRRVCGESQFLVQPVEALEERRTRCLVDATEAELGHRVSRDEDRQEDRRDEVGEDQHAVLRHLRVGDPLHASEHGIEEDDRYADVDARVDVDLQEAPEDDPHATHLARYVRERDEDRAQHGYHPRYLGVVAVPHELGDRESTVLAQIRRQQ